MLENIRVVLVEPSHPGNIGGACRALKTMGLSELWVVNPERYPDPQAQWRAAGAQDVLDNVRVCNSVDEAIADCHWVVGTSTRSRRIPWPIGEFAGIAGAGRFPGPEKPRQSHDPAAPLVYSSGTGRNRGADAARDCQTANRCLEHRGQRRGLAPQLALVAGGILDRFAGLLHTQRPSMSGGAAGASAPGERILRLTTKGRYAVTAMLDIALHQGGGAISVVDIASRQGISASYLEQIFSKLKRAGLLSSARGPGGGYRLTRPLEDVNLSNIIEAVGDGVDATRCHGAADCQDGGKCLTHDLWAELSQEINGFMRNITLAKLVQRSGAQQGQIQGLDTGLDLITARHL